jgi:hypothetical protein
MHFSQSDFSSLPSLFKCVPAGQSL